MQRDDPGLTERMERAKGWIKRALPWISLAMGLGGALIMERKPERAWMVAAATAGGWLMLFAVVVLGALDTERVEAEAAPPATGLAALLKRPVVVRVLHFSATMASQSLIQLSLFFALPFYALAATFSFGHAFFLLVSSIAAAVSLWDPIYYRVYAHRAGAVALQCFATFAGLACVMPVMGLSNRTSLLIAAALTMLGIPLLGWVAAPRQTRTYRAIGTELTIVLSLPLLLWIGGASIVPPAPLQLSAGAIGTKISDREVADPSEKIQGVPSQLVCATAVAAPRGLKDRLFHVWSHEGEEMDRIPLDVRGGREAGYRTWSVKKQLGAEPHGTWRCAVETESGQRLGSREVELVP